MATRSGGGSGSNGDLIAEIIGPAGTKIRSPRSLRERSRLQGQENPSESGEGDSTSGIDLDQVEQTSRPRAIPRWRRVERGTGIKNLRRLDPVRQSPAPNAGVGRDLPSMWHQALDERDILVIELHATSPRVERSFKTDEHPTIRGVEIDAASLGIDRRDRRSPRRIKGRPDSPTQEAPRRPRQGLDRQWTGRLAAVPSQGSRQVLENRRERRVRWGQRVSGVDATSDPGGHRRSESASCVNDSGGWSIRRHGIQETSQTSDPAPTEHTAKAPCPRSTRLASGIGFPPDPARFLRSRRTRPWGCPEGPSPPLPVLDEPQAVPAS